MDDSPPKFDPSGFSIAPGAQRTIKPWGYEILLTPNDSPYAAKMIHVDAGKRLSLQLHDEKIETQTLIDGKGYLVLEDENGELRNVPLEPGVGYHIAVGQRHRLCADPDHDVTVFEASTPETGTTWRLEDDANRPHQTLEERLRERLQHAASSWPDPARPEGGATIWDESDRTARTGTRRVSPDLSELA